MSIRVEGLSKVYKSGNEEVLVIECLSYEFPDRQTISIVGNSGVGKSTLLHILGTLELPTAGSVYIDGINVVGMDRTHLSAIRREKIGFIFQFHHLLADFTVLENVVMPLYLAGLKGDYVELKGRALLKRVGLAGKEGRLPSELSGGEQQRVAVCRGLINDPKVLLADEPTGNLDPRTAEEVMDLLIDISKSLGSTLIVATHNRELSKKCSVQLKLKAKGNLELLT